MALARKLVHALTLMIAIGLVAVAPTNAAQDNLIDASRAGDLSRVKALLAAKADVNAKTANGATALMIVSLSGDLEIAQVLLAARADVNAKTANGATALMLASQKGQLQIAQALLAAGAGVNAKMSNGVTALFMASQWDHVEVVRALLDAKADVDAKGPAGATALIQGAQQGHLDVVKTLIAAGANVNARRTDDGSTALFMAAQQGHMEVVRTLLTSKADVNAKTTDGYTALTVATRNSHRDVVEVLKAYVSPEVAADHPMPAAQVSQRQSLAIKSDTVITEDQLYRRYNWNGIHLVECKIPKGTVLSSAPISAECHMGNIEWRGPYKSKKEEFSFTVAQLSFMTQSERPIKLLPVELCIIRGKVAAATKRSV